MLVRPRVHSPSLSLSVVNFVHSRRRAPHPRHRSGRSAALGAQLRTGRHRLRARLRTWRHRLRARLRTWRHAPGFAPGAIASASALNVAPVATASATAPGVSRSIPPPPPKSRLLWAAPNASPRTEKAGGGRKTKANCKGKTRFSPKFLISLLHFALPPPPTKSARPNPREGDRHFPGEERPGAGSHAPPRARQGAGAHRPRQRRRRWWRTRWWKRRQTRTKSQNRRKTWLIPGCYDVIWISGWRGVEFVDGRTATTDWRRRLRRRESECPSKRSRTRRTTTLKTSGRSKNELPSFYDNLPQSRGSRHATSRRNKANQDKLNTDIFELYMEDLWKQIDEDKKSAYAYLDSLWFNMYYHGSNKPNVLKWIKSKRIFSRQYVFVPIVCFGHWSLLVLCHFDDANCSDIKKGPRMIVLDSLNTTDPTRLQSAIRKLFHNDGDGYKIFIADIYKTEEREESKQFINKIRLEFPKVPQQNGDECGIYVLYFIHCFLQNKKLAEVLENKKLEEDFTQLLDDGWFNPEELENFRKDIHSFQANRNNKVAE